MPLLLSLSERNAGMPIFLFLSVTASISVLTLLCLPLVIFYSSIVDFFVSTIDN